jgi:tetratricopeptide (TPR) repeat protein
MAKNGNVNAMLQLGFIYDQDRNYEQAEYWYEKLLEAGELTVKKYLLHLPERKRNTAHLAWQNNRSQWSEKSFDQIYNFCNEIIYLDPNHIEANGSLGWLFILEGRFQEALPFVQKAYELDVKNYAWTLNLGHVYLLKGDAQTAQTYYDKAISLIPDEKALETGPLADFDIFIEKGWQVEKCQKTKDWFKEHFKELQR